MFPTLLLKRREMAKSSGSQPPPVRGSVLGSPASFRNLLMLKPHPEKLEPKVMGAQHLRITGSEEARRHGE